jgi:hypothetical protein
MINKIKTFFVNLFKVFSDTKKYGEVIETLKTEVSKVKALELALQNKINKAEQIHTTIRTFYGENGDKEFWPWAKRLVASDEYKYLLFFLRENTIREYTQTSAPATMIEINGKLKMLAELDIYLNRGIEEYERDQKN